MSRSVQPSMWAMQPLDLLGQPLYPPAAVQGSSMLQLPQGVQGNAMLQLQGGTSSQSMEWMVSSLQAQVNKEHEDTAKSLAASQQTIEKVSALARESSDQFKA